MGAALTSRHSTAALTQLRDLDEDEDQVFDSDPQQQQHSDGVDAGTDVNTSDSLVLEPTATHRLVTSEEAVAAAGFGRFQYLLLVVCGSFWMADAMEVLVMSFLLPAARQEFQLTLQDQGMLGAVVFAGMTLGSFLWGSIADVIGRRKTYFLVLVFSGVFGFLSAFAPSFLVLTVCRLFSGLGFGGIFISFGLFTEFVPTEKRGVFLLVMQAFWSVGAAVEAALAWAIMPQYGWRYLLAVSALPMFLQMALYPWLPESPRWLIATGKHDEARKVLARVARVNSTANAGVSMLRFQHVSDQAKGRIWDVFVPALRLTSVLLMFIWFATSLCYYGLVLYSVNLVSGSSGSDSEGEEPVDLHDPSLYTDVFIMSAAELPGILVATTIINRLGRRNTMSIMFTVGCSAVLATASYYVPHTPRLLLVCFGSLARMCFNACFLTVYIYTPEAFPTKVRTTAMGLCAGMSKLAGMFTPFIAEHEVFVIPITVFACVAALGAGAAACLPVETAGAAMPDSVADTAMTERRQRRLIAGKDTGNGVIQRLASSAAKQGISNGHDQDATGATSHNGASVHAATSSSFDLRDGDDDDFDADLASDIDSDPILHAAASPAVMLATSLDSPAVVTAGAGGSVYDAVYSTHYLDSPAASPMAGAQPLLSPTIPMHPGNGARHRFAALPSRTIAAGGENDLGNELDLAEDGGSIKDVDVADRDDGHDEDERAAMLDARRSTSIDLS